MISLSKMITAELRNSLALDGATETFGMSMLERFEQVLPLPMWREIVHGELCYRCPVARLLAMPNHLDGDVVANRWRSLMLASRQKIVSDSAASQWPNSSEDEYFSPSTLVSWSVSWSEACKLEQAGPLLSWTLAAPGIRRWLALGASSTPGESDWAWMQPHLDGLVNFRKQRTQQREFDWQYSYSSSSQLIKFLSDAGRTAYGEPQSAIVDQSLKGLPGECSRFSSELNWQGLLPLILAQMSLVDAMALTPGKLVSATDQLSAAWVSWVRRQVLNDLRLRQMAEIALLADTASVSHRLLGLSLQVCFGVAPKEQL